MLFNKRFLNAGWSGPLVISSLRGTEENLTPDVVGFLFLIADIQIRRREYIFKFIYLNFGKYIFYVIIRQIVFKTLDQAIVFHCFYIFTEQWSVSQNWQYIFLIWRRAIIFIF